MPETKELRIGVVGAGSLGTAIVDGLLTAKDGKVRLTQIALGVTSSTSAEQLKQRYQSEQRIRVVQNDSRSVVDSSEVIFLACPPPAMKSAIEACGADSLDNKVLISVLAGVTREDIQAIVPKSCVVARTLPNLAVAQHASSTAIEITDGPKDQVELVDTIFEHLGSVVHMPGNLMDASTVLCGSTPAFIALFLDGLVDGAVAAGVPRQKAAMAIAQVMASSAALLKETGSPSALRESICAMPGCTIQGNLALEQAGTRGAAAGAMKMAIEAASKLG